MPDDIKLIVGLGLLTAVLAVLVCATVTETVPQKSPFQKLASASHQRIK
jgi:hypothetical protein